MWVKSRHAWELPERDATPEAVYVDRRRVLAAMGLGAIGAAMAAPSAVGQTAPPRNERFTLDRPLTDEQIAARHNIFDEFALERDRVWQAAAGFRTDGWKIHIGGQVPKALTLDLDELVRRAGGLEERLYRHRCVETWAMAVPWMGVPLRRLVEIAEPLAAARFVRILTVSRPEEMPGWYLSRRVFPYFEALSIEEATNELAFLATGIYGHALPPQHGAPIRLVVPWKYGFKSAKSVVALQFTAAQPTTFWSQLAPDRYDFWANVDPRATKPWSQSHETMLGSEERRETLPWNGYGELVAGLYG